MFPILKALRLSWITTRFFVSRMGIRKFISSSAGYLAFEAAVEETAEHSDWVRDNQSAILTTGLISTFGLYGLIGRARVASLKTASKAMFSKLKMVGNPKRLSSVLMRMKVATSSHSFKVSLPDGRFLSMKVLKNGKFEYTNKAGLIGAAVLAGGFTVAEGVKALTIDSETTAAQIAGVMSSLYLAEKEEELRSILRRTSALTLMQSGPSIVRSFMHENSGITEDTCVSILQSYLNDENTIINGVEVDAFVDAEGDEFIEINGTAYVFDDNVLEPGDPKGISGDPVSADILKLESSLISFFSQVSDEEGLDFVRVGKSNRFTSEIFLDDSFAIGFVWDIERDKMVLLIEESSLFDSAKENFDDETEEGSFEMVKRKTSELSNSVSETWNAVFGTSKSPEETAEQDKSKEVAMTNKLVFRNLTSITDAMAVNNVSN